MRLLTLLFALSLNSFAQWVPQHSGTDVTLRGLSVVSDQIVWASGAKGTYLRTTDGGAHWTAQQVPSAESLDFRDVEAFDAQHAILLSAGPAEKGQAKLYKTADAGAHWKLVYETQKPGAFLDCMAFWDHRNGIAVGDPIPDAGGTPHFMVLLTKDGGEHWREVPLQNLPPALKGEGAFAASGTCVAVAEKKHAWFATGGTAARVFRSTDGGEHWTVAETPIIHGEASQGIFTVAFASKKHGVIAGGDYQKPAEGRDNLAFSDDGGRTWRLAEHPIAQYISAITPDNYVVGTAGSVIVGQEKASRSTEGFNAIDSTGTRRGAVVFAVGDHGRLAKTQLYVLETDAPHAAH